MVSHFSSVGALVSLPKVSGPAWCRKSVVFTVPVPAAASKQMTVKEYTGEVRVWLGADGVPMAVREATKIKGRKFLISIEFGNTTDYSLRVIGNRLVVVSRHTEESHSVFGNSGSSATDAMLTPVSRPAS